MQNIVLTMMQWVYSVPITHFAQEAELYFNPKESLGIKCGGNFLFRRYIQHQVETTCFWQNMYIITSSESNFYLQIVSCTRPEYAFHIENTLCTKCRATPPPEIVFYSMCRVTPRHEAVPCIE